MSLGTWEPVKSSDFSQSLGGSAPDDMQVRPDVQLQRDQVRLAILQREQTENPSDVFLPKEIAETTKRQESGNPWGNNRGSRITGELSASKGQWIPVSANIGQSHGDAGEWVPVSRTIPEELKPSAAAKTPGVTESAGKGFAHGVFGLAEAVNTGLQFIGNRVGAKGAAEQGESGAQYWSEKAKPYEPHPEIQGSIADNPGLLAKGSWWAYNLADMAPSLAASIIPGVGAAKAITVAGKAIPLTEAVIQRLAIAGGAITGGATGGSLEGAQTYQEVLKRGAPEEEAAVAGSLMALASAALNAVSVGKAILPSKAGALRRFLTTGAVEGLTEWAEEPTEGAILSRTSVAKPEDDPTQRAIQGLNVLPIAAVMGGGAGVIAGGQREAAQVPQNAPQAAPAAPGPTAPAEPAAPAAGPSGPAAVDTMPTQAGKDLPLQFPGAQTYSYGQGVPPDGGPPGGGPGAPSPYNNIDKDGNRYRKFVSGGASYSGELYTPFHPDRIYAPDTPQDPNMRPLNPPVLSPIDQARVDAQALKSGQDLGLPPDNVRLKNATLLSIYGENAAVRHVIEGGDQFSAIGDAMLMAAPAVERVRGTIASNERSRDVTQEILGAVDEITKIRDSGKTVAEVLAEGVSHDISFEGQQLIQFLDENAANPKRLASFLESYLHEVESATGIPSQVRGRAFDIIEERNAARKAEEEKRQSEIKQRAFEKTEVAAKREKAATTIKAKEQESAERVLREIAVAKAAGSGINPGHLTAIELAFQNARKLKGKPNAKPKPEGGGTVQGPAPSGPKAGPGQNETGKREGPVPKPAETRQSGDTRSVREGSNRPGTQNAKQGAVNRGAQIAAELKPVDAAAHEAAASPKNELPQPTKAQILAGNPKLGHAIVGGLDISIENPEGSTREDKQNTPPKWKREIKAAHYGYVKGVPARSPDKDHVDAFVKPGTPEDYNGPVFVVDQNKGNGQFDESKTMIGYATEKEARSAYLKNYQPGWESRIRRITEMTMGQFKAKLQDEKAFMTPQGEEFKPTVTDRLKQQDLRAELSNMANEAGWAEVGGKLLRDGEGASAEEIANGTAPQVGNIIGRTKWIPRAAWWPDRPIKLNERQVNRVVMKALAGEALAKKETMLIDYMLDEAEHTIARGREDAVSVDNFAPEDYAEVGVLPEDQQDDALSLADETDGAKPDSWSTMSEDDKENELDNLFGKDTRKAAGGQAGGAEAPAAEVGQGKPALELSTQTEADLKAKAAAQEAADKAKTQADTKAAEAEKQAKIDAEIKSRQGIAADNFALETPVAGGKKAQQQADIRSAEHQMQGGDMFNQPKLEYTADGISAPPQVEQRKQAYNPNQIELIYDHTETRPGTTETQRSLGVAAMRALFLGDRRAGASLLGSALWADFQERAGSELIGKQAGNAQELALAAQILRDPRFETMRVFFTKGNTIVGHTGWTSRLPGAVGFSIESGVAERKVGAKDSGVGAKLRIALLQHEMDLAGADGYYLMHNHPSGKANPSGMDKTLTHVVAKQIPGFKGHVVIDHGQYAIINRYGDSEIKTIPASNKNAAELSHDTLGRLVSSPGALVEIGKMLTDGKKGFATLIATNGIGKVQALAEIPEAMLLQSKDPIGRGRAIVRIRKFMNQTGSAGGAFLVAENPARYDWLIQNGSLTDIVDASDDNSSRASIGITATKEQNHGRNVKMVLAAQQMQFPGYVAEQEKPSYARTASEAFDKAKGTFTDKLGEAKQAGYVATARSVVDRIDQALNPLGQLPEQRDYLIKRYLAQGLIEKADESAKDISQAFNKASEDDKQAIYDYFVSAGANSSGIKDGAIRAAAEQIKADIRRIGDELVEHGLLAQESRDAYKDAYLPRLYLKHLLSEQDWKALGAGKKPSDMGYLKARKDIPLEVRKVILGEITDPGFLAGIAIAKPARDMALLDWLGQISKNENWILPGTVVEFTSPLTGKTSTVTPFWLKEEASRLRKQARYYEAAEAVKAETEAKAMDAIADDALEGIQGEHSDYKAIPNTARYGRLRGMLVRTEIHADLMGINDFLPTDPGWFQNVFGYGGIGTRATQIWKGMKVTMNPPAQVRNFVSNGIAMQLFGGVPLRLVPARIFQAIDEIRNNGKHYAIAKDFGIGSSTFATQEVYRMKTELLDLELKTRGMGALGRLHRIAAFLMNKSSDMYQLMETVGKTGVIIDAMERQKMSKEDAVLLANHALFDYSLVQKSLRYARAAPIGVPFATYAVKVLPRLIETALLHPQRFIPWAALFYGFPMMVASLLDVDEDDLEKLKKAMPEWLQDKGHALILPWKDENNRWQVYDAGYTMPWGMWTQLGGNLAKGDLGKALQTAGIFGGPVTDIVIAIKTGKDPFTGREIMAKGDPPGRQAVALANYVWNMGMPPFLTDHGLLSPMGLLDTAYGGKMVQALTGTTNKYGEPRATEKQALLYLAGINVQAITPEYTRAQNLKTMQREMQDVNIQMRQKLYDRSLTPEQRTNVAKEYTDELVRRAKKMQKYVKESEIAPALQR